MIEVARKNSRRLSKCRFRRDDIRGAGRSEPEAFSLAISAQAWHWITPEIRFAKAAAALAPSGTLAVFGNVEMVKRISEPLQSEIARAYERHAPQLLNTKGVHWYLPTGPVEALFEQSGLFGPVIHKPYAWQVEHTAKSYATLMGTLSSHQLLTADIRNALLADIVEAIEARGGRIALPYETHLYMAHKTGRA